MNNPVIAIYKGVKIRHWNVVHLRFRSKEFKNLIDKAEETGISISRIIIHSSQPCDRCRGIDVVVYNDSDVPHKIERGLLKIPHQSSGLNIIQHNAKNNSDSSKDCEVS